MKCDIKKDIKIKERSVRFPTKPLTSCERLLKGFFIFFITLFSFNHYSQKSFDIFTHHFNFKYRELMCSDNVMALGQDLLTISAHEEDDMHVVFMRHKHAPYASITPQNPRHRRFMHRWTFHAILLTPAGVYDLDFGVRPSVLSLQEYLYVMWGDDALNSMVFQIKPFSLYKKEDFGGRFADDDRTWNLQELLDQLITPFPANTTW